MLLLYDFVDVSQPTHRFFLPSCTYGMKYSQKLRMDSPCDYLLARFYGVHSAATVTQY
jgi:hypothetical protein